MGEWWIGDRGERHANDNLWQATVGSLPPPRCMLQTKAARNDNKYQKKGERDACIFPPTRWSCLEGRQQLLPLSFPPSLYSTPLLHWAARACACALPSIASFVLSRVKVLRFASNCGLCHCCCCCRSASLSVVVAVDLTALWFMLLLLLLLPGGHISLCSIKPKRRQRTHRASRTKERPSQVFCSLKVVSRPPPTSLSTPSPGWTLRLTPPCPLSRCATWSKHF